MSDLHRKPTARVRVLGLFLLATIVLGTAVEPRAWGQAGDMFEGAVWKFTMKPKRPRMEDRRGVFRVNGGNLYQKENHGDTDFKKKIGYKSVVTRSSTTLVFTDLRAGRKDPGIKGKVVITMDSGGEWSGKMVDGEGVHWEFHCSRFQE